MQGLSNGPKNKRQDLYFPAYNFVDNRIRSASARISIVTSYVTNIREKLFFYMADVKYPETSKKGTPAPSYSIREEILTAEVDQTTKVTLTTNTPDSAINLISIVCELKSLCNDSVVTGIVDQLGPGEYCIQYTPTVRGRHELTVSVDGQQIAGSPFPVLVSISPTKLGKPVKMWCDLELPVGVTINSENSVIVSESSGDIKKLEKDGKNSILVKHSTTTLVCLGSLAVDSEDNIYCTDNKSNKILKCDKNGNNVQVFEVRQVAGPGHWGVAVVGDEVMVCEVQNQNTIMIYDRKLKYVGCIQPNIKGEFSGIAYGNGNLYVTDNSDDYHIRVLTLHGVHLHSFSCSQDGVKKLDEPYGICVYGQHVFVTNYFGENVSVFTTEGEFVASFGEGGEDDGKFDGPYGVCVDKDGNLYVADFSNERVQCF